MPLLEIAVPDYLNFSQPFTILLWLVAIVLALSLHEFCHALSATVLGDATAKNEGRLSLNPLVHIDPMGLLLAVVAGFGWAKPVPFNPYNLRVQKWGPTLVALSGPLSNFAQATLAAFVLRILIGMGYPMESPLVIFLGYYFLINTGLCLFNLLPLPPLDGSKLLLDALSGPQHTAKRIFLETRGPLILLGIMMLQVLFGISIFGTFFSVLYRLIFLPLLRIDVGVY